MSGAAERAHFCPFCGEPVGSFFGRFGAGGETWCERCEEWFRAERCDDPAANAGEASDVLSSRDPAERGPCPPTTRKHT